jgi:hypothetical protein
MTTRDYAVKWTPPESEATTRGLIERNFRYRDFAVRGGAATMVASFGTTFSVNEVEMVEDEGLVRHDLKEGLMAAGFDGLTHGGSSNRLTSPEHRSWRSPHPGKLLSPIRSDSFFSPVFPIPFGEDGFHAARVPPGRCDAMLYRCGRFGPSVQTDRLPSRPGNSPQSSPCDGGTSA